MGQRHPSPPALEVFLEASSEHLCNIIRIVKQNASFLVSRWELVLLFGKKYVLEVGALYELFRVDDKVCTLHLLSGLVLLNIRVTTETRLHLLFSLFALENEDRLGAYEKRLCRETVMEVLRDTGVLKTSAGEDGVLEGRFETGGGGLGDSALDDLVQEVLTTDPRVRSFLELEVTREAGLEVTKKEEMVLKETVSPRLLVS